LPVQRGRLLVQRFSLTSNRAAERCGERPDDQGLLDSAASLPPSVSNRPDVPLNLARADRSGNQPSSFHWSGFLIAGTISATI